MIVFWAGFLLLVFTMLALDLGILHRKAHVIRAKEALVWSGMWVSLSLLFTIFVYVAYSNHWLGIGAEIDVIDGTINNGRSAAIKYLTGYVIEYSLSVDNIFVIAMIFNAFRVPAQYQHRVLFWGILGALLMRGALIGIGTTLIARYHWVIYIFAVFLIVTGVRMFFTKAAETEVTDNFVLRYARRHFPVTSEYREQHFTVVENGRLLLTPLALALILVETTDLIFAVDSVPAIFAITADPFLVFTSNVFAILGLRSLYFALAGLIDKFRYLKYSLGVILLLVGVKMLIADWLKDILGAGFNYYVLGVIALVLMMGIIASLIATRREESKVPAAL